MTFSSSNQSSILIDNSTYFSARRTTQEAILDAPGVYNLSNFLEALVFADTVYLAPTTDWSPIDELLFSATGPCKAIEITNWNDEDLRVLFRNAVAECLEDMNELENPSSASLTLDDYRNAYRLIQSWHDEIEREPRSFIQTYSGAVYFNDGASQEFISHIPSQVVRNMPSSRHYSQFLLRTNVAIQLSPLVPYLPHSHRVPLAVAKVHSRQIRVNSLSTALLREAEQVITSQIQANLRDSILKQVNTGFRHVENNVPLILCVVLSGSGTVSDIIPETLRIRDLPEARKYREWTGKLTAAAKSDNYSDQLTAEQELQEARRVLTSELHKLFGASNCKLPSKQLAFFDSIDYKELSKQNYLAAGLSIVGKSVPGLYAWLSDNHRRSHMFLLFSLARQRREKTSELNALLKRVFGSGLDTAQLEKLHELWDTQRKLVQPLT